MKTIQIFNDFTCWLVWNERMLAHWTQVSDRCPLGYLLIILVSGVTIIKEDWTSFFKTTSQTKVNLIVIALDSSRGSLSIAIEHKLKFKYEPSHDKINNVVLRPAKTQISLGIQPVRSESSLSTWRKLRSLAIHFAHSEDSDQTRRTVILLVLSWGGSIVMMSNILINAWKWIFGWTHNTHFQPKKILWPKFRQEKY